LLPSGCGAECLPACFPSFQKTVLFIFNGQMDQEEFLLHLTLENEDITFLKPSGAVIQRRSTTYKKTGILKFAWASLKLNIYNTELCFDLVFMKAADTSISKRVRNEILMGNCVCVLPA
jgi:hypothetical protein